MKTNFSGELEGLAARERSQLEKLGAKRVNPHELIGPDLAKRAASLASRLNKLLAIIIGRDGRVSHVVLGTPERLYLPDLGRFRLGKRRLRNLRLIVFDPNADLTKQHSRLLVRNAALGGAFEERNEGDKSIRSPEIAADFLTDVERLRFDALVLLDASHGDPGAATLAFLEVDERQRALGQGFEAERGIRVEPLSSLYDYQVDFLSFVAEVEGDLARLKLETTALDGERALLVGAYTSNLEIAGQSMDELAELARTAGLAVVDTVMQRRKRLDPRTLLGKGKIEELVLYALDQEVDLLVFDRELSPSQLRNVTDLTELRVIDRSMLILDIFAQRAVTSEGRLQVELAQLKYSLPRLSERGTGLSRLTGGIGGRGPGETKLEIGRRRTRDRIAELERRTEKVSKQRGLRRERRQARGVPVVAIVGYTNAGKSTLLNQITDSDVLVEGKLFATLDPSSRRMRFPDEREVLFVDTVGFIRELPEELIAAFKATLEEVLEADLLLHLVDAAAPDVLRRIAIVRETLADIGANTKPELLVLNKADQLTELERSSLEKQTGGLTIAALRKQGFEQLIEEIRQRLVGSFVGEDPAGFIRA